MNEDNTAYEYTGPNYRLMATAATDRLTLIPILISESDDGGRPAHADRAMAMFRQVWIEDEDGTITEVLKDNLGTLSIPMSEGENV